MAIKFNPTGTFIVAILENDPLTLIFIRTSDSLILGTQRHNRPAGYIQDPRPCQGECIAFSENSNHMYFALQSIYLNTMEAGYFPLKCFDRWMTFNQPLCVEKRYEVMKTAYAVDITGATPVTITPTWSARFNREGRANTIKVLNAGGTDNVFSGGHISLDDSVLSNRYYYPIVAAHSPITGVSNFAWGSYIHVDK